LVEPDVRTMVGGMFAIDHIGPDAFNAISSRFEANPTTYLDEAVRLAKASTREQLSSSYITYLVDRVSKQEPKAARVAAEDLLPLYRNAQRLALASPHDPFEPTRFRERIAELEIIQKQR
jgi:hypothetical protein